MRHPISNYGPRECPFCGTRDQLYFGYNFHPSAGNQWRNGTQVRCGRCRTCVPEFLYGKECQNEGEEKAVELWNDRVTDQPKLF